MQSVLLSRSVLASVGVRAARRVPSAVSVRGFAAPAKGKGGGGKKNEVVEEVVDLEKVVPTNIFKDGHHPELKPKDQYPEWLFKLLEPKAPLGALERRGFDNLSFEEKRRFLSLANTKRIKTINGRKAKK